ncbi:hypothetical protein PUN28_010897 [Cardiocondyla obscurior]|uniref:MADF domain-containing protein n=3 Tax=Cardiocondyla obscurior TaxID=286306 RepID=A0AAW2FIM4_9HYME
MSDHQDYCNNFTAVIHRDNYLSSNNNEQDNIILEERSGDEFLIELFRERSFLYDKSNKNFKNILMKENAWKEISKAMIETNCGDCYTPEYCLKRCTSLREQYNREKRKIEAQ